MNKTAHFLRVKQLTAGFTMIELLIVIAVLGVLTVAVISAINPIEQINRGKDTGRMSDSEQLIGAIDRYYTSQGYYPWKVAGATTGEQEWNSVDSTGWKDTGAVNNVLDKLSSGGSAELKSSFVTRVSALSPKLMAFNKGGQGDSSYVCFVPNSADFRQKAYNRCTATEDFGSLPGDYPTETNAGPGKGACPTTACTGAASVGVATGCFYCLP